MLVTAPATRSGLSPILCALRVTLAALKPPASSALRALSASATCLKLRWMVALMMDLLVEAHCARAPRFTAHSWAARIPMWMRASAAEAGDGAGVVFDFRRLREETADQRAPFLEIGAAAEIDGVIFQRLPADHQVIGAGRFDAVVEAHRHAAGGALEQWHGLRHGRFEGGAVFGLDIQFGDFINHVRSLGRVAGWPGMGIPTR